MGSGDGDGGGPHLLVVEGDVEVLQLLEVGLPEGGGLLHLEADEAEVLEAGAVLGHGPQVAGLQGAHLAQGRWAGGGGAGDRWADGQVVGSKVRYQGGSLNL